MTRRKHIELAIGITAALQAEGTADVRLLISGPPGPHNPGQPGLPGRVDGAGRRPVAVVGACTSWEPGDSPPLDDQTVAELFDLADALLFTSRSEGFGIPILEAGLARLPVFCTDIPPFRESGQDDVTYLSLDVAPHRRGGRDPADTPRRPALPAAAKSPARFHMVQAGVRAPPAAVGRHARCLNRHRPPPRRLAFPQSAACHRPGRSRIRDAGGDRPGPGSGARGRPAGAGARRTGRGSQRGAASAPGRRAASCAGWSTPPGAGRAPGPVCASRFPPGSTCSKSSGNENPDVLVLEWPTHFLALDADVDQVLAAPACDTLIVRGPLPHPGQRVIVPVRGGPHAELALRIALRLRPAQLTVLHLTPASGPTADAPFLGLQRVLRRLPEVELQDGDHRRTRRQTILEASGQLRRRRAGHHAPAPRISQPDAGTGVARRLLDESPDRSHRRSHPPPAAGFPDRRDRRRAGDLDPGRQMVRREHLPGRRVRGPGAAGGAESASRA